MRALVCILLAAFILVFAPRAEAQDCTFSFWQDFKGDRLMRHQSHKAYFFVTDHMRIDADGAPNAYHPEDRGLDFLANAGFPTEHWWSSVLVPDPDDPSTAFVQPDGPFAGFFVSKTALNDPSLAKTDPARYVDATRVPYLVFPRPFVRLAGTGRLGDLGFAINLESGQSTPFIVADIGPSNARLGEVSMALAEGLGGQNVNPRTGAGAPPGDMLYVVFRFSSPASSAARWPVSADEMARRVDDLLASVGGCDGVTACLE